MNELIRQFAPLSKIYFKSFIFQTAQYKSPTLKYF
jgi:hypothetical protein